MSPSIGAGEVEKEKQIEIVEANGEITKDEVISSEALAEAVPAEKTAEVASAVDTTEEKVPVVLPTEETIAVASSANEPVPSEPIGKDTTTPAEEKVEMLTENTQNVNGKAEEAPKPEQTPQEIIPAEENTTEDLIAAETPETKPETPSEATPQEHISAKEKTTEETVA